MRSQLRLAPVAVAACLLLAAGCSSDESAGATGATEATGSMILATTTSTQDSGLLDAILPDFEKRSDCAPKTVAVGSGEALQLGANGDADVLLVHSPAAEEEYAAAGHSASREAVMHNDFVLVGPPEDPAGAEGAPDGAQALSRIAKKRSPFASRADDSGTNAKELALWEEAGIKPSGSWYLETGQGMGPTLTIASQKGAYTLADRGTFLATSKLSSKIMYEGSPDLRNPYHVIVVKSERKTNLACAQDFSTWIRSAPVQRSIADFGVEEYGQPLFFPDAAK